MERLDALLLGGPLHGQTLPVLPTTQRVEVAVPTVRDPAAIGRYVLILPRTFPILVFQYEGGQVPPQQGSTISAAEYAVT